jgi:hypothetical protein
MAKTKYHNGDYRVYKEKTQPVKRISKKCNKPFEQPKRTQFNAGNYFEYCPECRVKRDREVHKNKYCIFCGKLLPKFRKNHSRLAFCNDSCQMNYTIDYYRKRNANLKLKEVVSEVKP